MTSSYKLLTIIVQEEELLKNKEVETKRKDVASLDDISQKSS